MKFSFSTWLLTLLWGFYKLYINLCICRLLSNYIFIIPVYLLQYIFSPAPNLILGFLKQNVDLK